MNTDFFSICASAPWENTPKKQRPAKRPYNVHSTDSPERIALCETCTVPEKYCKGEKKCPYLPKPEKATATCDTCPTKSLCQARGWKCKEMM